MISLAERQLTLLKNMTPALVLAGATLVCIALLTLRPHPGDKVVALVFPPWWSIERTLSAAASIDAGIIRTGALPSVIIVKISDRDALKNLKRTGAWFAVSAQAVRGCSAG